MPTAFPFKLKHAPALNRLCSRRGVTLLYAVVMVAALAAFCSLAVEWGRVQVAKTELQRGADAAARAAAGTIASGVTAAQDAAISIAAANSCDGTSISLNRSNDIEFGAWNSSTHTFTVLTGPAQN